MATPVLLPAMEINLVSSEDEDEDEAPAPTSATTPKRLRETTAHAPNLSCKKALFGPPCQALSDSADGEQSRRQDASASGSADHFDDGLDELLLQIPMPAGTRAAPADPAATQPTAAAVATPSTVTRPAAAAPAAVTPAATTPAATTPAAATPAAATPAAATPSKQCDIRGFLAPRALAMVNSDDEGEIKAAQAAAKAARISAALSERATAEQAVTAEAEVVAEAARAAAEVIAAEVTAAAAAVAAAAVEVTAEAVAAEAATAEVAAAKASAADVVDAGMAEATVSAAAVVDADTEAEEEEATQEEVPAQSSDETEGEGESEGQGEGETEDETEGEGDGEGEGEDEDEGEGEGEGGFEGEDEGAVVPAKSTVSQESVEGEYSNSQPTICGYFQASKADRKPLSIVRADRGDKVAIPHLQIPSHPSDSLRPAYISLPPLSSASSPYTLHLPPCKVVLSLYDHSTLALQPWREAGFTRHRVAKPPPPPLPCPWTSAAWSLLAASEVYGANRAQAAPIHPRLQLLGGLEAWRLGDGGVEAWSLGGLEACRGPSRPPQAAPRRLSLTHPPFNPQVLRL